MNIREEIVFDCKKWERLTYCPDVFDLSISITLGDLFSDHYPAALGQEWTDHGAFSSRSLQYMNTVQDVSGMCFHCPAAVPLGHHIIA
ncbi:hypothetical protein E2C01_021933 [Portunus trituberculatus]|uniref:Uncharacterized protein n=1 Tax=Portunus trituberculatus TaxID=210409 RepID=A0A5B7E430_PORTR|nr:hypothetical protein [Portunus trituberculatus]